MRGVIAVVEDEIDILELVSLHLKKEHFSVRTYLDGSTFLKSLAGDPPSLIVLDLMLPDVSGFDICRHLKSTKDHASIPLIMLTARSEETDRVLGLELGADDYVTKPFSPRELAARVKAVLRRTVPDEGEVERIQVEGVTIDPRRYEVTVGGRQADLTTTEFKLLQLLASKIGWVFTRDKILTHLWGTDKMVIDRTVDVHIKHLREKLGNAGALIKNVRGVGYKMDSVDVPSDGG
jgi:DNA-binding response OmpR family regulator